MAVSPDTAGSPSTLRPAPSRVRKTGRRRLLECETLENRRLLSQSASPFRMSDNTTSWPEHAIQVGKFNLSQSTNPPAPSPYFSALAATTAPPAFQVLGSIRPDSSSSSSTSTSTLPEGPYSSPLDLPEIHPTSSLYPTIDPSDGPPTRIDGKLEAPDGAPVYRILFNPGASSIRLDAEAFGPNPKQGGEVMLWDGQGRPLDNFGLPEQGERLSLLVESRGDDTPADSSLLVGIYSNGNGNPSGTAEPSTGTAATSLTDSSANANTFAMWISRNDVSPALSGPIVSNGPQPLSTTNSSSSMQTETSAGQTPTVGLGDDSVGPMPTRSVGPSAGVLSDGTPIPQVDRNEAAVIDLSLVDLMADDEQSGLAVSRREQRDAPDGLVEIRSPGGFPLLGAALAVPESAAEEVAGSSLATISARRPFSLPIENKHPDPLRPNSASPGTLLLGLGLAGSFAYTLMLPDLENRLEPETPKRRLPWSRT